MAPRSPTEQLWISRLYISTFPLTDCWCCYLDWQWVCTLCYPSAINLFLCYLQIGSWDSAFPCPRSIKRLQVGFVMDDDRLQWSWSLQSDAGEQWTVNQKTGRLRCGLSSPRCCYSGCWMELSAEIATILQMGTQEPRHFYQFIQVNFVQLDQQQAAAAVVLMFWL